MPARREEPETSFDSCYVAKRLATSQSSIGGPIMRLNSLWAALAVVFLTAPLSGAEEQKVFRLGIIGLDTSHVVAFTQVINNPAKNYGCKVVAGYPGGSLGIN